MSTQIKHGWYGTPEYKAWCAMKRRCLNPRAKHFRDYGARGIQICPQWLESFGSFIADLGPRPSPQHSLDRINNDGNYEPGNCRWATKHEQARNRRSNLAVEYKGEIKSLSEWCDLMSLNYSTMLWRIQSGWSPFDAFTTPIIDPSEQTHCSKGHAFTLKNTYYYGKAGKYRMCKTCLRQNQRNRRARLRSGLS